MKYFISDLDKTLIFAKKEKYNMDDNLLKSAEKYENRDVTFMTYKSNELLKKVLNMYHFIPCTMRNITQTLRVDFVREYNPKYIICTNGAEIYIDGKLDEFWDNEMKKLVTKEEIINLQEKVNNLNLDLVENRNVNDFYLALKFKTENFIIYLTEQPEGECTSPALAKSY